MSFASIAEQLKKERIFITGHSGFKGAWLSLWLEQIGAFVAGYSLPLREEDQLYRLAMRDSQVQSKWGDIRDADNLVNAMSSAKPSIVLHLAAEALVPSSFDRPLDFISVNALGTANVLEAVRQTPSVKSVVVVTTDKVYKDQKWDWGYRENDQLGGHDIYSASKACAELITSSYCSSFFSGDRQIGLATARAGNVIGGGDFAKNRIIPDLIRAARAGQVTELRRPEAVRPWQFVLEPLAGYLRLAANLLNNPKKFSTAWNFGPNIENSVSVGKLAELASNHWADIRFRTGPQPEFTETTGLRLDSSQAKLQLGWKPVYDTPCALEKTLDFYREMQEFPSGARAAAVRQIGEYQERA